jgi:transposase
LAAVWRKLLVAHLKLCASRAFVLVAYPSQGHEMLFDAHTRSFAALGGIPRRGIYDNMKTAVDRVKRARGRSSMPALPRWLALPVRRRLLQCRQSGWEKGVVEKNVQDSRRRIWQEAGSLRFS